MKACPTVVKPGEKVTIENIPGGYYMARFQNITSALIYRSGFTVINEKSKIELPKKQLPFGIYYLVIEKDGRQLPGAKKIIISNN